jgi:hypothetical protein
MEADIWIPRPQHGRGADVVLTQQRSLVPRSLKASFQAPDAGKESCNLVFRLRSRISGAARPDDSLLHIYKPHHSQTIIQQSTSASKAHSSGSLYRPTCRDLIEAALQAPRVARIRLDQMADA